jgi:hypothetical protein
MHMTAWTPESGVVGIQCCAGSGFSAHLKRLCEENVQATKEWLDTPGAKLEIWAWRKVKRVRGGKAMIWQPRIKAITIKVLKHRKKKNEKIVQRTKT